jgi:hypothetical protein
MQAAPSVVFLVGRAPEGCREVRACQQVKRINEALQEQKVAPVVGLRQTRYVEEVEPGGTDTLVGVEVVEQVAQRFDRTRARRGIETDSCERVSNDVYQRLATPD